MKEDCIARPALGPEVLMETELIEISSSAEWPRSAAEDLLLFENLDATFRWSDPFDPNAVAAAGGGGRGKGKGERKQVLCM